MLSTSIELANIWRTHSVSISEYIHIKEGKEWWLVGGDPGEGVSLETACALETPNIGKGECDLVSVRAVWAGVRLSEASAAVPRPEAAVGWRRFSSFSMFLHSLTSTAFGFVLVLCVGPLRSIAASSSCTWTSCNASFCEQLQHSDRSGARVPCSWASTAGFPTDSASLYIGRCFFEDSCAKFRNNVNYAWVIQT